ncbi:hypothetical protein GCM10009775_35170 [Microbacterium aoyamense]|uniref:Uncharacterized protein n=1 Tax=Microbacterium aoyamense TaxID=344166 RepID=A0ABN2Q309_9MICO|nr:hypothetical protein [Microbacterium aoyamense]
MTDSAPEKTRWAAWLDARFRSPAAIYGLIVFAAFVTISSDHSHDAWGLLNTAVWTLLVFFIAHVFAETLTAHGERGLRASIAHAVAHAAGMLYAAVPGTIVLIVCGINGVSVDDAYEATMWVTWVVLAILGYVAYWRRGAHIAIRLLGALGTAALGLSIVLLEYAVH